MNISVLKQPYNYLLLLVLSTIIGLLVTYLGILTFIIIVALSLIIVVWKKPLFGLYVVLLLFIINPLVVTRLMPTYLNISPLMVEVIGYGKDMLLLLLLMKVIVTKRIKLNAINFYLFILLLFALPYIFMNVNIIQGAMGYRYYFETIIMIFIASHLTNLHKSNLIVFVKGLIISSVVISLLGIYISIFLGIPFMFEVGYTNYNGAPHYSYLISGNNNILRVFGTFASPNNLATFLSIVIISQIIIKDEFKWKKFYWVTLFIQVLALFLTFSRSSWLAFLLCLLIYFLFLYRASKAIRNFILATFITMCSGIIYILLHPENAVWSLFVRTITLQDSSTIGHIDSWINDFKFILDNPLGIGLGLAGPKAFQETGVYLVPENSYYLLAFEVGIIGMCLFLGFNIILFGVLLKKFKRYAGLNKKIIGIGLFSLLILNFVFLFLPTIQEMEVTIIAYTLIGLALGIKNDETHKLSGCGGCL